MKDEIIMEVWRNRELLAQRYGHDLDAIVEAMRKSKPRPRKRKAKAAKPKDAM